MGQLRQIKHQRIGELCYAAIDFESAGAAAGETDHPIQVGIVRAQQLFAHEQHYCQYIACQHPIHWRAAKVHHISKEQLKDAPSFVEQWTDIKTLLQNSIVIGHNLSTEKRFLSAFPGHGFGPWLDTLKLARKIIPDAGDYSLGALCEGLGLKDEIQRMSPQKNWHDAHFDALASLVLLRYIVKALDMSDQQLAQLEFCIN